MKSIAFFALLLATFSLFVSGCNKNERTVDTSKLERSFSTGDPEQKSTVDKVVASVREKNYSGAMAELKNLTSNAKLTPEQKASISDTLKQLQHEFTDTAKKVAADAKDGLNKALNK
ncbi:MAG TPA: hypothetical protein VMZ27_12775 [Candidatus Saccharimonadales bacterium]|nr:hypothetical protein [Candidatus Saccharimonadales bacterium]